MLYNNLCTLQTIHKKMATAVDLLRRAVESEKSADIKESFRLYKDSIEILLEALKSMNMRPFNFDYSIRLNKRSALMIAHGYIC